VDPEVEFLDVGPSDSPDDVRRRRRRRGLVLLIAAALAATVVTVLVRNGQTSSPTAHHTTTPPPPAVTTSEQQGPPRPPAVADLGHPLLAGAAGFDLFGRGAGVVVRVQLRLGRVTQTAVPTLLSGGPVEFVPAAGRVIIRPIDDVPGYVVRDGRPASPTPPGGGGPILPGPDQNHVWAESRGAMVLTAVDGSRTSTVIPYPNGASPLDATPDGSGNVLFVTSGGIYDGRRDGVRRISTGSLLAVGPTGWLVTEHCAQHCITVLIDQATGNRRVLGPAPSGGRAGYGVISPDGATAAMFAVGHTGHVTPYLLDLVSGARRPLHIDIYQAITDGTVVWSPGGRWLFAVGSTGRVRIFDVVTGQVSTLDAPLPNLTQLAIRPDPSVGRTHP
jgi:WD40 repeat protein